MVGQNWWARPTLRKNAYMLFQDRGSRRPTHGVAVGYSDAAPYGAGRVFTNADLLTPEGSHIIAHGCAVGPLGVANISMSSRLGVQDFEPLVQGSNPQRCLLPSPRRRTRRPTHGVAVGYSAVAPCGAGRVFANGDLLTPEGSHRIAHSIAMGHNGPNVPARPPGSKYHINLLSPART